MKATFLEFAKWCGDSGHRRIAATAIILLLGIVTGKELSASSDTIIAVLGVVGALAGGWSKSTPKITDADIAKAEAESNTDSN